MRWPDISKCVGWDTQHVPIPHRDKAQSLVDRALAGDVGAAVAMLRINRFAPSPSTPEEIESINIIAENIGKIQAEFS